VDAAAWLAALAVLSALLLTESGARLRTAVGSSPSAHALIVLALAGVARLPFAWYCGYRLERQYELSQIRVREWVGGQAKTAAVAIVVALPLAELVYWAMRWPSAWWLVAAAGCAAVTGLLTAAGPVLVMPLLQQSRPVVREVLCHRLERLSLRAGVPVLGVHELPLGERTRRASAALVGAGSTRRILLSDTLLSNYSDDEIEVVMAHEIGHHVHRHLLKATIAEILLLLVGFRAAAAALDGSWQWLGLTSPGDVAGMPLMLIVVGAVLVATTPLLNWWSRSQERRADLFALENASQPAAFIDAVRRMSAQNLAEDRPSSAAFLFFHTHPTAEERIAAAKNLLGEADRAPRLRAHRGGV
jgi:STE24 endopeptidase